MDISFLSIHNNSRRLFDTSQSILNQSYETPTIFTEYSSLAEYNPNSNIDQIYNGFKEITKTCSENSHYLKMIDDFNNVLSNYLDTIKKTSSMFSRNQNTELSNSALIIYNEIRTWKLINLLYEDRFKEKLVNKPKYLHKSNVLHSELEVLTNLYQSNKDLREAQIVVDWLEFFLKEKLDSNTEFLIGSHGKSWEHTKYSINKGTKFLISKNRDVNELDPDAPLRGKLVISTSDKTNEDEYLRYLYHCVQSGDIDKAKTICYYHDESWRAQSLDGWKPFHNPFNGDIHQSDISQNDVIGNPNRSLFKLACHKLSDNNALNIYERGIYATFCGNLSVLAIIEKEWAGLLWAHFKVYIESTVETHLRAFTDTGFHNTQSLFGQDDWRLERFKVLLDASAWPNSSAGAAVTVGSNLSLEEIFDEISLMLIHDPVAILQKGFGCEDGREQKLSMNYYQSIFEMVQQYVILEDIGGLVDQIHLVITHFPAKKSLSDKNIIRFLTHLIIFVYSIHEDLPIDKYHSVLEQYISCLLDDKWLNNVAFYISKLSTDLQIKCYCDCLAGVTSLVERRKCVEDGLDYDLPIIEVTRLLVESVRIQLTQESNAGTEAHNVGVGPIFVSEEDKAHIDALDWLGFLREQQSYLVREANAFARAFLERDQLQAAKMVQYLLIILNYYWLIQVMNKISDDAWSQLNIAVDAGPIWLRSILYENECLRSYIECHDLFGDWYNHFTCQKPADVDLSVSGDLNRLSFQEKQLLQKKHEDHLLAMQQWQKLLHFHADKAFDCFVSALQMGSAGWLSDTATADEALLSMEVTDDVIRQQHRLRRKCIVAVVFMAVNVAVSSQQHEKCFIMTDLVADDQYRLFSVFDKDQLHKLLQKAKQCSLHLMAAGKDALVIQI